MSLNPLYSFSAYISGTSSYGTIHRQDGETVAVAESEMPELLLDLAADGSGLPGRPKHHERVLAEWFVRKTAPARPKLRVVG